MTSNRASYKKYVRAALPPTVAPTEDDVKLFLALYRHGVLDAHAVYLLFQNRSVPVLRRRLRKLYDAGYLQRLKQMKQIFVPGGGSLPEVYVLGEAGFAWLFVNHQLSATDWHRRLPRRSAAYLVHDIEAARFAIALRASVENQPGVEFLYLSEYYRRFAPKMLERSTPARVSARVRWFNHAEVEGTIPDFQFLLYYPEKPAGQQFRSFALEFCRAKETVEPGADTLRTQAFWKHTSILRKFVVYAYAMKTGSYLEDFGMPLSHVLMVTQDSDKVRQMQGVFRNHLEVSPHQISSRRFLFADMETIGDYENVLAASFEDGRGEPFSPLP